MPIANRQVLLDERPRGIPKLDDFRIVETTLAEPSEGQMLLRTLYLSLDSSVRVRMGGATSYMPPIDLGGVMVGCAISRVETSLHPLFEPGELVLSEAGWQEYTISDGYGVAKLDSRIRNPTHALSVLGMPGFTAYHGLLHVGKLAAKETVVIAAASGAVGSIAGQLAKLKGARVIGIAGGEEKCRHVVENLGFDKCIDRHADDFHHKLADACPHDVDVYFENVGGSVLDAVIPLLNIGARVPVCGMASHYNERSEPLGVHSAQKLLINLLNKRVHMEGFVAQDHRATGFDRFMRDMNGWVGKGAIKIYETFAEGLDRAPYAFIELMNGRNFGKLIVRV